jgi:hypothetical protein
VEEKAGVLRNQRLLIDEGGVIVWSTILGPGVAHGRAARTPIGIYNREGIFTNRPTTSKASGARSLARVNAGLGGVRLRDCLPCG